MTERRLYGLIATVLLNEIVPREKKYGNRIPANLTGALCVLEHEKQIDRRRHRELLDLIFESYRQNADEG